MTLKIFIAAFAMLLGATAVSLAQSLPNYGPNAPATGDSFGNRRAARTRPEAAIVPMPINRGGITGTNGTGSTSGHTNSLSSNVAAVGNIRDGRAAKLRRRVGAPAASIVTQHKRIARRVMPRRCAAPRARSSRAPMRYAIPHGPVSLIRTVIERPLCGLVTVRACAKRPGACSSRVAARVKSLASGGPFAGRIRTRENFLPGAVAGRLDVLVD